MAIRNAEVDVKVELDKTSKRLIKGLTRELRAARLSNATPAQPLFKHSIRLDEPAADCGYERKPAEHFQKGAKR